MIEAVNKSPFLLRHTVQPGFAMAWKIPWDFGNRIRFEIRFEKEFLFKSKMKVHQFNSYVS